MTPARLEGIVYGAGALRAAAHGDRMMWALHRAALTHGVVPVVTVGAVAEAYRTEPRGDRLDALLAGAEIEPLGRGGAQRIGELAKRAGTADLLAVSTAETAARRNAAIVNTRQAALRAAITALGHDLVQYGV
ncbi:MAG: twitching motility protein PilT [Actinomycetota bacterium]|nr:twitching motility protein PilT [Actinomycetota bacterium]